MIKSMTGFGRGKCQGEGKEFLVEIKSVNHRYCDVSVKIPKQISFLEDKIREMLLKSVSRGKVDIFVSYSDNGSFLNTVILDEVLAKGYIDSIRTLSTNYGLKDDISVSLIANLPDVLKIEKCKEDESQLLEMLEQALKEAISGLLGMREKEGRELRNNLLEKIKLMEQLVEDIEKNSDTVVEEYKTRLQIRIKELLDKQSIDDERISMEAAIFAERSCVDEELVRLKSHMVQFKETINTNQSVGRKLDFIVQEMNREINTIGSKANSICISKSVVDVKSELEKIREQVQNIE